MFIWRVVPEFIAIFLGDDTKDSEEEPLMTKECLKIVSDCDSLHSFNKGNWACEDKTLCVLIHY